MNNLLKELSKEYIRTKDFTKRLMKEFIYVFQESIKTESELLHYIELGLEHTKSKH